MTKGQALLIRRSIIKGVHERMAIKGVDQKFVFAYTDGVGYETLHGVHTPFAVSYTVCWGKRNHYMELGGLIIDDERLSFFWHQEHITVNIADPDSFGAMSEIIASHASQMSWNSHARWIHPRKLLPPRKHPITRELK